MSALSEITCDSCALLQRSDPKNEALKNFSKEMLITLLSNFTDNIAGRYFLKQSLDPELNKVSIISLS